LYCLFSHSIAIFSTTEISVAHSKLGVSLGIMEYPAPNDAAVSFEPFELADVPLSDDNTGYGFLLATNLDWCKLGNDLLNAESIMLPGWDEDILMAARNFNGQYTKEHSRDQVESQTLPGQTLSGQSVDTARQLKLLEEIENIEANIRELEDQPRHQLILSIRKTEVWHELQRLREPAESSTRTKKLVSLELEDAKLRLELMEMDHSAKDLDEDEVYLELKLKKIRLTRELDTIKQGTVTSSPLVQTSTGVKVPETQNPGTDLLASLPKDTGPQQDANDNTLIQVPTSKDSQAVHTEGIITISKKRFHPEGTAIMTTLRLPMEQVPSKRKLTSDQIQNRQGVIKAGGQCLNCRSNRSKQACSGGSMCSQCAVDGLECIRPTFGDKNIFSASRSRFHLKLGYPTDWRQDLTYCIKSTLQGLPPRAKRPLLSR
jgi:hypothetical protein